MMTNEIKALTADFYQRNVLEETKRLIGKWSKTKLLNGLDEAKQGIIARLLENQAGQLLKEASTQADIIGFQNVAFPIVRRVFGGLIANELVSVQPMSLPSGLIFYLDYTYDSLKAGNKADDFAAGGSVFGARSSLQNSLAEKGLYNLGTSFSQREKVSVATFSGTLSAATLSDIDHDPDLSGSIGLAGYRKLTLTLGYSILQGSGSAYDAGALKHWVAVSGSSTSAGSSTDGTPTQHGTMKIYRRHTKASGNDLTMIVSGTVADFSDLRSLKVSYLIAPTLTGGTSGTLVLDPFESDLAASPTPAIPEVSFNIQSLSVTAQPRKLKVKWTPELAQDLAAYQNLDAEVELTQFMSELVALEIDREILNDLLQNATAANYYWSRQPGNIVNKTTGVQVSASFTGTVREWYETLIETIIDVANTIHRKTLRGAGNFVVTSPDVCTILEASVLYKPQLSMDPKESMFQVGTEKIASLASRFTVYKDPYFIRNKILVGFKGGTFLDTGFVYAPYVPLIVTPTIYAPEDGTPRKMVMTRYAKQLVRSDFYGTVTVMDMNVI